jgi:nucleoside-diphosphate-sugar epimerase
MADAFTINPIESLIKPDRTVLVTGAAGRIGSYFAEHAPKRFKLRLMIRPGDDGAWRLEQFGEVVPAQLSNLDRLKELCDGIDTVVHMAGDPSPSATWDDLLDANIVGTYNLMVAAKHAGCRRVVHASSIHAVSGYPADYQVKTSDPVNPGDLYGVSKCFGEALGRYMAEQEGLSVITIRIGGFQPLETAQKPGDVSMMDGFVSHRDLHQLLVRCVDDESIRFAILHGLSDNRFKRLDLTDTKELLGFQPEDDFTKENPSLKDLNLAENVMSHSNIQDGGESGLRAELL